MKEFKGRQTINYDREHSVDETCVAFAPMPMPLVKKGLSVPIGTSPLEGVKSYERKLPVRPKNLVSLANALSNVSKEPIEVILNKLVKDTIKEAETFSENSSFYRDFEGVLRGYPFGSESDIRSVDSAPYSAILFDENYGTAIQQQLALIERGSMTTQELVEDIRRMREQQEASYDVVDTSMGRTITGGRRQPVYPGQPQQTLPRRMGGVRSRESSVADVPVVPLEILLGERVEL